MSELGPNVLLLMTDQQRWDTLGSMGGPVESTNLDSLAAEGTVFTHAYSATPSCSPARASLMTGMDPWHTGILGQGPGQPFCGNLHNTLPELLAASGYHTQGVGKMHFHPQRSLQGFHHTVISIAHGIVTDYDEWFERNRPADCEHRGHGISSNSWVARPNHLPEYLHMTTWTATESIRFLKRRDPTKPFFLKVSFNAPHSPYDAPQYYFNLYQQKVLPCPAVGTWATEHDVSVAVDSHVANPDAWHGRRTDEQTHRARAGYYGNIHFIDDQIGRILREIDDNTIVVFTSDHGDMLGDHHLWRKTYGYEGSAHVPLIVRLPRHLRNGVLSQCDVPTCLQDIMPTILDACGLEIPDTVDGSSLIRPLYGETAGWRPYVHGEHCMSYTPNQEMHYLTNGTWKYIWFPRTGQEQLFHLSDDPYEQYNLAEELAYDRELNWWRGELITILKCRDVGLVDGDKLIRQDGRPVIVSPHAADRDVSLRRSSIPQEILERLNVVPKERRAAFLEQIGYR